MGKRVEAFVQGMALEAVLFGGGELLDIPDWAAWVLVVIAAPVALWPVASWIVSADVPLPIGRVSLHRASIAFYKGTKGDFRSLVAGMNTAPGMLDFAKVAFIEAAKDGMISLYGRRHPEIDHEKVTGQIGALHPFGQSDIGYPGDKSPQWFDVKVRWQDIAKVRRRYHQR